MSDSIELYCEWCLVDRGTGQAGVVPPLGRWAVVFRDCPGCLIREDVDTTLADQSLVPNILCTNHFTALIRQRLPDACQECGHVRSNFTQIIERVLPVDPFASAPRTPAAETTHGRFTVLDGGAIDNDEDDRG